MICSEFKLLNLLYILQSKFPDEIYIKYRPGIGIKIITQNKNLYKEIEQLKYFKEHNFFIDKITFEYDPHLFNIYMKKPEIENIVLNRVFNDFEKILNSYNVNISMISETGFIIENIDDINLINEINNNINNDNFYRSTNIDNTYIFLI
jgi:hypothetical protein